MTIPISTRLLEALFSHFCHDLISPVTAISNGMELMEELGAEGGGEAIELVAHSAALASARLQIYRMAYGMAGRDTMLRSEDMCRLVKQLLEAEDNKHTIDWPAADFADLDQNGPEAWGKTALCCIILVKEALARGGNVSVRLIAANQIEITGQGQGVRMPNMGEAVDSQNAHMALTQHFSDDLGFSIDIDSGEDFIKLELALPAQ